jgi:hypothetical protein
LPDLKCVQNFLSAGFVWRDHNGLFRIYNPSLCIFSPIPDEKETKILPISKKKEKVMN